MMSQHDLARQFAHLGIPDHIWSKIEVSPNGCWLWIASLSGPGYGKVTYSRAGVRSTRSMHRFMYERINGPASSELALDHLCEVRRCCNPAHLELVTLGENTRRWFAKHVTHCKAGHEYVEGSYSVIHNGRGYYKRDCRACRLASGARQRAKRKAS